MISDASPLGGPAAAHPGAATKEVATVGEPPLWMVMGVCQLVDHIEHTHHRHLWNELPRLDDLTTGVLRMHGDHHPELITIRRDLEGLGATLVPHLLDEEQVLFPRIRELATASDVPARRRRSLADAISTMLTEHDDVSGSRSCGLRWRDTGRPVTTTAPPTGRCSQDSANSRPTPISTSTRRTTCCSRP